MRKTGWTSLHDENNVKIYIPARNENNLLRFHDSVSLPPVWFSGRIFVLFQKQSSGSIAKKHSKSSYQLLSNSLRSGSDGFIFVRYDFGSHVPPEYLEGECLSVPPQEIIPSAISKNPLLKTKNEYSIKVINDFGRWP